VCAGHPGVFGYSIGNEIPASIVRWHGRRRVEKFIERLYRIAKEEDPDALVTYVNYPSTEYLRLPFLDFVSSNVYLESRRSLEDYLARLHSLSNDRPVLLSEIGLDSLRNGEEKQASMLAGQVRAGLRVGRAGARGFARLDRRDAEDRIRVSCPPHHDQESGAERRAQPRHPGRRRGDRRVHR